MLHSFEDFCTWMYVIVDDLYQQIAPHRPPLSPAGACSRMLR